MEEKFKQIIFDEQGFKDADKNGVFIFMLDSCRICLNYLEELAKEQINVSTWTLVKCDEEYRYFLQEENIDDIPITKVYKDGKIIWEKTGVLFNKQRKDLYDSLHSS